MSKKILITGANGQLGSVLSEHFNTLYNKEQIVLSDINVKSNSNNQFVKLDVLNINNIKDVIKEFDITEIYHLAAILSAKAENDPLKSWNVNFTGTLNVFNAVLQTRKDIKIFFPSSIAVFGATSPDILTPQECPLLPTSNYGISKVSGELWSNYYYTKSGLDIRGLRFPGIISYQSLPGGGTTDYAMEMYLAAIKGEDYNCFLREDTMLPMMYIDDAMRAIVKLMDTEKHSIKIRTAYNLAAISFTPKELYKSIRSFYPDFKVEYNPDFRQGIADSWTSSIDDSSAREDWGWRNDFDLELMTKTMIDNLRLKYSREKILN